MNMAEYNGVWVFAEQRSGELQKVSLEILGEGRRLANELGVSLDYLVGTHIKKRKIIRNVGNMKIKLLKR